jgi:SAM-dependent methyltransferase
MAADDGTSGPGSAPAGAAAVWREALHSWDIPAEIRARAEVDPDWHPQWLYEHRLQQLQGRRTVSSQRAVEALPPGGSVLDVGAGAGSASLPLAFRAGRIVAVDEKADLLQAFAREADRARVEHELVQGSWPEVSKSLDDADVVVCHNALYGVMELGTFVAAMAAKARKRTVIELSESHPYSYFASLWERLHGIQRSTGPTAYDAISVITEDVGIVPEVDQWHRLSYWEGVSPEKIVTIARIRLCLPSTMDREIGSILNFDDMKAPQPAVTIWWDAR